MKPSKKLASAVTVVAVLSLVGVAGAATGAIITRGAGPGAAALKCPGGMTNMGYPHGEDMSVFPFDPASHVEDVYTVAADFFEVERVTMSSHAGTHLDVPRHFVEGARGLTDLDASEFVWPVYKIKVSEMDLDDGQLQITKDDIKDYEDEYGRIKQGSLVVLDTSIGDEFNLDDAGDAYLTDADDLAQNTDDLWTVENEGFSGDAINWMFDKRKIDGVGSDAYGPDAYDDVDFLATYNTLANDGVALVALDNVESLNVRGDIIIAPTVRLEEGGGFPTNPIACHGARNNGHGNDYDD